MRYKRYLVTGGAGFMGSAFVRYLLKKPVEQVVVYDLLTYAGNLDNLRSVEGDPRYQFVKGDVNDASLLQELVKKQKIDVIVHFAAESHVDTSIANPRLFFTTNTMGTLTLLETVQAFPHIHFHQISTDEVFGSLNEGEFVESSPYRPNSPYAASKASADHIVRSFAKTYGLSVTLSYANNNFGPRQDAEKFIPKMVANCLQNKPLPLYGDGTNVRDWLFVEDHADAVFTILEKGQKGEGYNISGGSPWRNIDLLHLLIAQVAKQTGLSPSTYHDLIAFVQDRPGHDFRYALNGSKLVNELGWSPQHPFETAIAATVEYSISCLKSFA